MPHTELARVGYVVKRYPRYSETFIVNEILAHEAAGVEVEIFSLRPPVDTHFQERIARVRAPARHLRGGGRAEPPRLQRPGSRGIPLPPPRGSASPDRGGRPARREERVRRPYRGLRPAGWPRPRVRLPVPRQRRAGRRPAGPG